MTTTMTVTMALRDRGLYAQAGAMPPNPGVRWLAEGGPVWRLIPVRYTPRTRGYNYRHDDHDGDRLGYQAQPDGTITAEGRPTGYTIHDLDDTGDTADYVCGPGAGTCVRCGIPFREMRGGLGAMTVEIIDRTQPPYWPINVSLACRSCNTKLRHEMRRATAGRPAWTPEAAAESLGEGG